MIRKIPFPGSAFDVYRAISAREKMPSVLLESARALGQTGRYSLVCSNPFLVFRARGEHITLHSKGHVKSFKGDALKILKSLLKKHSRKPIKSTLPFTGGAVGYFGYEAGEYFDPKFSFKSKSDLKLPDIYLMFFDSGIIWDHKAGKTFVFTNKTGANFRQGGILPTGKVGVSQGAQSEAAHKTSRDIRSSFSRDQFIKATQRIKRYIQKGDVYQVNLAQRLSFMLGEDPLHIYGVLRQINPSPFFGYLDAGDFQIVSGSPERLVRLRKNTLETRPIAGTRPRGKNLKADQKIGKELLLNEKERAEHIMLVDLERNDLGRVSQYGSVCVDQLMTTENYSHVKHIVSNVKGTLKSGLDGLDALRAVFPGGTITGTPKFRCMEIIKELEPVARGPYTGSMGYFAFTGDMDWNIIIRSLVVKNKKAYLHVGAGIVADSEPSKEFAETLYKAEAVLSAVFGKAKARQFIRRKLAAT